VPLLLCLHLPGTPPAGRCCIAAERLLCWEDLEVGGSGACLLCFCLLAAGAPRVLCFTWRIAVPLCLSRLCSCSAAYAAARDAPIGRIQRSAGGGRTHRLVPRRRRLRCSSAHAREYVERAAEPPVGWDDGRCPPWCSAAPLPHCCISCFLLPALYVCLFVASVC